MNKEFDLNKILAQKDRLVREKCFFHFEHIIGKLIGSVNGTESAKKLWSPTLADISD